MTGETFRRGAASLMSKRVEELEKMIQESKDEVKRLSDENFQLKVEVDNLQSLSNMRAGSITHSSFAMNPRANTSLVRLFIHQLKALPQDHGNFPVANIYHLSKTTEFFDFYNHSNFIDWVGIYLSSLTFPRHEFLQARKL